MVIEDSHSNEKSGGDKAGALESASNSDGLVITDLKRRRMEDHGKKVETGGPKAKIGSSDVELVESTQVEEPKNLKLAGPVT